MTWSHHQPALAAIGTRRTWPAGTTLFQEGEQSTHVLLLESGRVKVSSSAPTGKQVVLAIRGAGDLLGEFSAIDGRTRSATVTTLTTASVIVVSGSAFQSFLSTNGAAALALLRLVVGRLREADLQRLEFGAYAVGERIARLLLDFADRYGERGAEQSGVVISLPLSQAELANATGASREAVAKALRRLRELGAVRTARRRVEVLRPELLARLAENWELDGVSVHSDADRSGRSG